jgi:hypothetical protein
MKTSKNDSVLECRSQSRSSVIDTRITQSVEGSSLFDANHEISNQQNGDELSSVFTLPDTTTSAQELDTYWDRMMPKAQEDTRYHQTRKAEQMAHNAMEIDRGIAADREFEVLREKAQAVVDTFAAMINTKPLWGSAGERLGELKDFLDALRR